MLRRGANCNECSVEYVVGRYSNMEFDKSFIGYRFVAITKYNYKSSTCYECKVKRQDTRCMILYIREDNMDDPHTISNQPVPSPSFKKHYYDS